MERYSNDPRKIIAKFDSTCSRCTKMVKKNSNAYYWPKNKKVMCQTCGLPEYQQFLASVQDEENYNKMY